MKFSELSLAEGPKDPKDICPDCNKPDADCECEELAEMTIAESQAAGMTAQNDKKKKSGLKKPAANEGAPQPGQMRGPKPHITRGRSPDPVGESSHMSENAENTAVDMVSLDEFKSVTTKLDERVRLAEEKARVAEERLQLAERQATERDVADEVRTLSEKRTIKTDGGDVVTRYGIPSVVTDMYREFALSEPSRRSVVRDMLAKLSEVGLVALTSVGTAQEGIENDPDGGATGKSLDDKILNRSRQLALADGKDFDNLTGGEKMLFGLRAEKEVRGR